MMREDSAFVKSSNKLVWAINELSKELEQTDSRAAATQAKGEIQRIFDRKKGHRLQSIDSRASIGDAMRFMEMHHTGFLAVYDERRFLGIFSERWLVKNFILHGSISLDAPVEQYLDTATFELDQQATVEDYLNLMMTTQKWHLPVMEKGHLVGILSLGDLIQHVVSKDGGRLCFGGHGPAMLTMLRTL